MYCGTRLDWDGKEHQIRFSVSKIYEIVLGDDILVEDESVAEEVQVNVAVLLGF